MTRDPLRRAAVSALLGAPWPLAFIGGMSMQAEMHADRAAFYILLPALLFGMMGFAVWTLMRRPVAPSGSSHAR
jgi:hypothetical protein